MADLAALARAHMAQQVRDAGVIQVALSGVWDRTMDPRNFDASFARFQASALPLIAAGRTRSESTAQTYYSALKGAEDLGPEVAATRQPFSPDATRKSLAASARMDLVTTRVAGGAPVGDTLATAKAKVLRSAKRQTLQAGRRRLHSLAKADDDIVAVARVSDGKPCAFCAMLVSRGPVYTETSADFRAHDGCGCSLRLVTANDPDGGWEPDARKYRALWDEVAGVTDWRTAYGLARAEGRFDDIPAIDVDVVPTIPAWLEEHRAIVAALPEERHTLGITERTVTGEEQLAAAIDYSKQYHGGLGPDEWAKALEEAEAQLPLVNDLIEATRSHWNATKWPAEATPLARALGISRRQPRTAIPDLYVLKNDLETRAYTARWEVEAWERELKSKRESGFYRDKVDTVEDLDDMGRLGKDTADALDAVLDAGRVIDEEVERRIVARLGERPDAALIAARRAVDEAEADWDKWRLEFRRVLKENDDWDAPAAVEAKRLRDEANARLSAAQDAALAVEVDYKALRAWEAARKDAYAGVVREVLAETRPMGAGYRPAYRYGDDARSKREATDLREAMERAHENYPSAWNDRAARYQPDVQLLAVERGYNRGGYEIALSRRPDGYLGVATHELGHTMESAIPGLRAMEWALHYRRSRKVVDADGRESLAPAEDIYGRDIGMGAELHVPDEWANPYVGKSYKAMRGGSLGAQSSWEVFTMGAESLFNGSPYFDRRDGDDVEFRRFMLGVLSAL